MSRGSRHRLLLVTCLAAACLAVARADETDGFRIEPTGTLRLPVEVETDAGDRRPLTGLSGLAWLGNRDWVAAVDNSDQLATFALTLDADGGPQAVTDIALRRLPAHHDYEDVAVWPPRLARAGDTAGSAATRPPAGPWLLVCEEDTPALRLVALADCRELAVIPTPDAFRLRRVNRGFEAVAIDPAGESIWTATEEALPADGPAATADGGTVVRLTQIAVTDTAFRSGRDRQFAYGVDPPHAAVRTFAGHPLSGVVALVAVARGRLLVMERSFVAGLPPFENRIYLVDTASAPDIALVQSRLAERPPATRLAKRLLWKGSLGVNLEGLALGPPLAAGQRSLVAIADNGGTEAATLLAAFRLTRPPAPATSP